MNYQLPYAVWNSPERNGWPITHAVFLNSRSLDLAAFLKAAPVFLDSSPIFSVRTLH
jgi:hypothetical protein